MKVIAILAGSMTQYSEHKDIFCDPETEKMVYAVTPNKIMPYRFDEYRVVGTFLERNDASDILREVKARTANQPLS